MRVIALPVLLRFGGQLRHHDLLRAANGTSAEYSCLERITCVIACDEDDWYVISVF